MPNSDSTNSPEISTEELKKKLFAPSISPSETPTEPYPESLNEIAPHQRGKYSGAILEDRYRLGKLLAKGGIGEVYLAVDLTKKEGEPGSQVVAKVLLEDSAKDQYLILKFYNEIEALKRIKHPNVVGFFDAGKFSDGNPCLIIEFVEGATLTQYLQPGQGMDFDFAADLIEQIGEALQAAHQNNIVHRDLKPENIMVARIDNKLTVKVIDFGIATVKQFEDEATKLTATVGTIEYMAFEQIYGMPNAKSDVYAFGVIIYEMLAGRRPYQIRAAISGEALFKLTELQKTGNYPRIDSLRQDIPPKAAELIHQALETDQKLRPKSAFDFSRALIAALLDGDISPPTPDTYANAHHLFVGILGFSQSTKDEQGRLKGELQEVVFGTTAFQEAQNLQKLIHQHTEDGLALSFFTETPRLPVACAIEISKALKGKNLPLRMGINTGLVSRVIKGGPPNVSGDGVNLAQRVMECGNEGHIMVSKTTADLLLPISEPYRSWLHPVGKWNFKQGGELELFNLYSGEFGNAAPPRCEQPRPSWTKFLVAGAIIITLFAGGGYQLYSRRVGTQIPPKIPVGKSTLSLRVEGQKYDSIISKTKVGDPYPVDPQNTLFKIDPKSGTILDECRITANTDQKGYLYILTKYIPPGSYPKYAILPHEGGIEGKTDGKVEWKAPPEDYLVIPPNGDFQFIVIWSRNPIPEIASQGKPGLAAPQTASWLDRFLKTHPPSPVSKSPLGWYELTFDQTMSFALASFPLKTTGTSVRTGR